MKKFLSTLIIGAFVFGLGALNVQTASAAPFNKAGYSTKKPEPPKNIGNHRQGQQQHGKKFR